MKYGYSLRGIPVCDYRLLVRGKRYSAIPVISLDGIRDVYITERTVNGGKFADFVRNCLLPVLQPFNHSTDQRQLYCRTRVTHVYFGHVITDRTHARHKRTIRVYLGTCARAGIVKSFLQQQKPKKVALLL